jgi:hypothetical protein
VGKFLETAVSAALPFPSGGALSRGTGAGMLVVLTGARQPFLPERLMRAAPVKGSRRFNLGRREPTSRGICRR